MDHSVHFFLVRCITTWCLEHQPYIRPSQLLAMINIDPGCGGTRGESLRPMRVVDSTTPRLPVVAQPVVIGTNTLTTLRCRRRRRSRPPRSTCPPPCSFPPPVPEIVCAGARIGVFNGQSTRRRAERERLRAFDALRRDSPQTKPSRSFLSRPPCKRTDTGPPGPSLAHP